MIFCRNLVRSVRNDSGLLAAKACDACKDFSECVIFLSAAAFNATFPKSSCLWLLVKGDKSKKGQVQIT
jgi:hypothetical protein